MARNNSEEKRMEFLSAAFNCFVENGLENTSIRDLCAQTGISSGSFYYWFDNKETLFIDATEYGTEKVLDDIFSYASKHISDIRFLLDTCLDEIDKNLKSFKFIFQVATSPVYGERFRKKSDTLVTVYEKYAKQLAVCFKCSEEEIRPLVYLYVAAISNYVIWEDTDKTKLRFDYILESIEKHARNANIVI